MPLNAYESALMLAQLALAEVRKPAATDLRAQLAKLRLEKAVEALQGSVDMEAYEMKVLGLPR